jgi:exo-beta-1,3-glucanase (GH17 family)
LAGSRAKANAKRVSRPSSHANPIAAAVALYVLTALAVAVIWWWLGTPVVLPPSPLADGGKLYCVSYAPFRGAQNPLVEGTYGDPAQIDADMALIAKYSNCVRTYSTDDVRDYVLQSARRYGLKVLNGIWISNKTERNRREVAAAIAYAKQYSDVMSAIVVGNEVLLRGELSAADLSGYIREVKSQVSVPVTYADVWEFWLRYPDVQNAVDFITIHILPYWEDFPLAASLAAAHVAAIHHEVAQALPNKDILIGEVGWPSAGRMREAARPSLSNQARVISETLAVAQREHFRVNVIEAFDQPWKQPLEGSVGAHWGIFDRDSQAPKFPFSGIVSDHPHWLAQAAAGIALAGLCFIAAWLAGWRKERPPLVWPKTAAIALLPAILFGWTLETIPAESFSLGSWLRALSFALVAALAPIACAAACAGGRRAPSFAALLSRSGNNRDALSLVLGGSLIALTLISLESALGLVFDPRYRDLPFAPQSAAAFAFLLLSFFTARAAGQRPAAENLAAAVLAVSAAYIAINETFANWQAVWLCAGFIGLAVILLRARDAPG